MLVGNCSVPSFKHKLNYIKISLSSFVYVYNNINIFLYESVETFLYRRL